jgi:hypothetical protein
MRARLIAPTRLSGTQSLRIFSCMTRKAEWPASTSSGSMIRRVFPARRRGAVPPLSKNISRRGPLNRRSLGFARDDKGNRNASTEPGCWTEGALTAAGQPLSLENAAVPFVIPSEAEGSAVQRTCPENVFDILGYHHAKSVSFLARSTSRVKVRGIPYLAWYGRNLTDPSSSR